MRPSPLKLLARAGLCRERGLPGFPGAGLGSESEWSARYKVHGWHSVFSALELEKTDVGSEKHPLHETVAVKSIN